MKRLRLHPAAPASQALNEQPFSWEASSVEYRPPYFFRGRKSEVFKKRAMENYFSSVYRQAKPWLERFKLVASGRFCLDSRFFTGLGRRKIEIDASIALRLASSVNRRE
jgi:hypothetical protein